MGMTITVEVLDLSVSQKDITEVFEYFEYVDSIFSTYKESSEISKINAGTLQKKEYSKDMKEILKLSEETKVRTDGYFDIEQDGKIDPSGMVKGWAIFNSAKILEKKGFENYFVDAGGDIQARGKNKEGKNWRVGIKNPFNIKEIIKVVQLEDCGMATSGTYLRGQHIYNPRLPESLIDDIVSLTVIGPNVYEADRFATAAFAMGKKGILFIENLAGFEGYMIDAKAVATYTSGFTHFVVNNELH